MSKQHPLPAIIRKEIRSCIAVKMMNTIFKRNKVVIRTVYMMMRDYYHGNSSIKSSLDTLLAGEGEFEPMFINATISTVTDNVLSPAGVGGRSNSSSNGSRNLALNNSMFCLNNEYIVGKHITKFILESRTAHRSSGLVSGRSLHDVAKKAMANMKKALSLLYNMTEVTARTPMGCEYKSGVTEEEVKMKLLQLMFVELKGKEDCDDEEDLLDDKVDDVESPLELLNEAGDVIPCPANWYFNGWFAFCLFGPFVPEANRISIIEPNGTKADSNLSNGRTAARKRKKQEEDEMRAFDSQNKRGVSLELKLHIANLELKQETIHQQKKDRKVLALTTQLQMVQSNIERTEKRAMYFSKEYDATSPLWEEVNKHVAKADEVQLELAALATYLPAPKRINVTDSPIKESLRRTNIISTTTSTPPPVNEVSITDHLNQNVYC